MRACWRAFHLNKGTLRREPAAGLALMLLFKALSKWAMRRVLPVSPVGTDFDWRYNAFELLF
ncbi:MAG: hypothetical protein JWR14_2734 [Caballeronia sp.]|nr:hypothetical protein [Caballeronia sp.]